MMLGDMFTEILPAVGLLLLFTIIGGVIILRVRKNLKSTPEKTIIFTLRDLEKMRDGGFLTEAEYDRAKKSIIEYTMRGTTDSHQNLIQRTESENKSG